MTYYQIVRDLPELTGEDLRCHKSAIRVEQQLREQRAIMDQLYFEEEVNGQRNFENDLVQATRAK